MPELPLKTICKIRDENDHITEYLAADFKHDFNENWGNAEQGAVFKNPNSQFETLSQKDYFDLIEQSVFKIFIEETTLSYRTPLPKSYWKSCMEKSILGSS